MNVDEDENVRLENIAIEKAEAERLYMEGLQHEEGTNGTPKDETKAKTLYHASAELNFPDAQFKMGCFYDTGRGGPSVKSEALRWYQLAAVQGHVRALKNVGRFHLVGMGGIKKDEKEGLRLYQLAADQGYAPAQCDLGFFYEHGMAGLEKDEQEALRLYRLAADQGDVRGQLNVGHFFKEGRGGIRKSTQEAKKFFALAAAQGDSEAEAQLQHLIQDCPTVRPHISFRRKLPANKNVGSEK